MDRSQLLPQAQTKSDADALDQIALVLRNRQGSPAQLDSTIRRIVEQTGRPTETAPRGLLA